MQTSDNFAAGANTKPLYNRLFGTEGHEFLSANRTFWVDADDGSDTTGGAQPSLQNTRSCAIRTLTQAAEALTGCSAEKARLMKLR